MPVAIKAWALGLGSRSLSAVCSLSTSATIASTAFAKREHWLLQREFSGNRFFWGILFSVATLLAVVFGGVWLLQSWGTPWVLPVALGAGTLVGAPFAMAVTLFRMVYSAPEANEQAGAGAQPPG